MDLQTDDEELIRLGRLGGRIDEEKEDVTGLTTEVTSDVPGSIRRVLGDETSDGYVDEGDEDEEYEGYGDEAEDVESGF